MFRTAVPGINPNGPSTVARIMIGYATDPIDNLITEFLPDVARHIHVSVIFAQRLINQVSGDQYSSRRTLSVALPTLPFAACFPHSMQHIAIR